MATITIPKKLIKNREDLIVVERGSLERLEKENDELQLAMKAVLAGESALRRGKTRTFSHFLRRKLPQYAPNK